VPDWLSGLRGDAPSAPASPAKKNTSDFDPSRGATRIFSAPPDGGTPPAFPAESVEPAPEAGEPDWLKSLQSSGSAMAEDVSTPAAEPSALPGGDSLPDWLSGMAAGTPASPAETAAPSEPAPAAESAAGLDWLDQLKQKADEQQPPAGEAAAGTESAPDWLASFGPGPGTPTSAPGESVPEWLSNLEAKTGSPLAGTGPLINSETPPASAGDNPDWLSNLQADVSAAAEAEKHKDDFEVVSEPEPEPLKGTGPLPEWLAGIDRSTPPAETGSTPALIAENQDGAANQGGDAAFSMESPDWLSKLKPEQAGEKAFESEEQAESETGNLEAAELPSWVQAMRPVEAVVSETAAVPPQEENQETEQSGPLAGLRGVLPAAPGLGTLRKPPVYSVKLQVSDGQQRYAAFLERLVAGETQPRAREIKRLGSSRLWRWLISAMLILAVGLPLFTGVQVVPPTGLAASDGGATTLQIAALSGNTPVLVAFDYDPALSGELEATAAPIFDQLLSKGIPLVLISTSPTGPALAERFLTTDIPLVNIHGNELQYIDLGYLAGGPSGISYFSMDPRNAGQYSGNTGIDWGVAPLWGIKRLSDFSAVVVLTDNADTGRNWVEQTGPYLARTASARIPILMIISAQAEPMLRPYFDSGQIKGLVAGLSDAKIYEQTYTRPGLADHYWNAYSLGILVAVVLIGLGSVWSAINAWRARISKTEEEA
jgi:hypothetical protein